MSFNVVIISSVCVLANYPHSSVITMKLFQKVWLVWFCAS